MMQDPEPFYPYRPPLDRVWNGREYVQRPERDLVPEWKKVEIRKLIAAGRRVN